MKKVVKKYDKGGAKPPVKKNGAVGKATAYKTINAPTGNSLDFSGKTKVAYNKKNNTKTVVNYKADGTKQVKVINYSKAAAAKAPGKTLTKLPEITITANRKKPTTIKKGTVKTNPTKVVEEPITPLATKKPSEVVPSVSSINMSPVTNTKSTADRVKAPVKKSTPSMGERLTGYKSTSRPVASAPVSTTPTPTETTSGRVSLMDRIKGNIAKRKMKKMAKLSEQVAQSRAMGSYAQPAMKKGGSTKSFPDFSKDGKVTKKDILIAKGVIPKAKKGGSTTDKKWIQKAINPAHKGYCTPMSKPTCTPKRKALAITLKKMAKNK